MKCPSRSGVICQQTALTEPQAAANCQEATRPLASRRPDIVDTEFTGIKPFHRSTIAGDRPFVGQVVSSMPWEWYGIDQAIRFRRCLESP